jgi:hypothetical protein
MAPEVEFFSRYGTADFHIRWETTRISEYEETIMHETASQLQRFLRLNESAGIFPRMHHEAVEARNARRCVPENVQARLR